MALGDKFLRLVALSYTSWQESFRNMARILDRRHLEIVEETQQVDEELNIQYVSDAVEPTIEGNENALFWHDGVNARYYLILKTGVGQKKVELV